MGKVSKLSRSKRTEIQKQRLAAQPGRTEANRKRKQARHTKKHPNDKTIEQ